jgi:hypothetical protein
MNSRLFFVALPLLLIFAGAPITRVGERPDKRISRFQTFFVLVAAYSMVVFALGLVARGLVNNAYQDIPGSASAYASLSPRDIERIRNYPNPEGIDPRRDGGQHYFYSAKRQVFTPVSKDTWERALFLERLTICPVYVSIVTWGFSILILVATRRFFLIDSDMERLSK